MVLRHKATYNGKLNIEDRPKFVKDLESFEGKPFYIVLRKDVSEDLDYLNKYYWACIVDGFGKDIGYTKEEAHDVLKEKYGLKRREKVDVKLDDENLETILGLVSKTLKNFASASNIKEIRENNAVYLEYVQGYSVMTAKERIAYHNRCREGLFKECNLNLPNEREVEI